MNTPLRPSINTCPTRDPAPKDHSLYAHAKRRGRTDQLNDLRESDGNAPVIQSEAGILGRNIAYGSIPNQFVIVKSNTARSAAGIMVRQTVELRQAPYIRMRSLCIHPQGEEDQVGTPCKKMHTSQLCNQWGFRLSPIGPIQF